MKKATEKSERPFPHLKRFDISALLTDSKMLMLLEVIAYQTSNKNLEFHEYIEKLYTQTMYPKEVKNG